MAIFHVKPWFPPPVLEQELEISGERPDVCPVIQPTASKQWPHAHGYHSPDRKISGLFQTKLQTTYGANAHVLIENLLVTKFRSRFSNWLKSTQNAQHQICKKN